MKDRAPAVGKCCRQAPTISIDDKSHIAHLVGMSLSRGYNTLLNIAGTLLAQPCKSGASAPR
jgi:hypothetical protein